MANKLLTLLGVGLLILAFQFSSLPQKEKAEDTSILFASPFVLKAISVNFHNLFADYLWLLSNAIGEMKAGTEAVDIEDFYHASHTIILLDPYFFQSVNYFASFFSNALDDAYRSLALYRLAKVYDKNNYELILSEISTALSKLPASKRDYDYLINQAKFMLTLPSGKADMKSLKLKNDEFIEFLINVYQTPEFQERIEVENLVDLYLQANNLQQKAIIVAKIKKLKDAFYRTVKIYSKTTTQYKNTAKVITEIFNDHTL